MKSFDSLWAELVAKLEARPDGSGRSRQLMPEYTP